MIGPEQLLGPLAGQVFNHVREFTATVVALAGIPLGVLVREHRTHGLEHGFAHEVFRSNQFQTFVLTANFAVNRHRDLRIDFIQRAGHVIIVFHGRYSCRLGIPENR
jgi:hypothetical protein